MTDASCFTTGFCKYPDTSTIPTSYTCKLLTIDTNYEALKNDGFCTTRGNSAVSCALGDMCLDPSTSFCTPFIATSRLDSNVGRRLDGKCFSEGDISISQALRCSKDFCLLPTSYCTRLSILKYVGREEGTTLCLEVTDTARTANSCSI